MVGSYITRFVQNLARALFLKSTEILINKCPTIEHAVKFISEGLDKKGCSNVLVLISQVGTDKINE